MKIGEIGLGLEGGNICRGLTESGHHCAVFQTEVSPRSALGVLDPHIPSRLTSETIDTVPKSLERMQADV